MSALQVRLHHDDILALTLASPSRHAEQDAVESICALGGYLLSNLPQDVAISLFQCLMQRILPIWLKPNVFQTVPADRARES